MFPDLDRAMRRLSQLGAVKAFCKPLAENDNSKQQIYLGGNLEAVQMFPLRAIEASKTGTEGTYKAKLDFHWVTEDSTEPASGAQLILYPQYPEVRLSGFLIGCKCAPNALLRPLGKDERRHNNGPDGRVLIFGITADGRTLALLAPPTSNLAKEILGRVAKDDFPKESVFYSLPLLGRDSRSILLDRLTEIRQVGWQPSIRLNVAGVVQPYLASNGGGYTLEALLNVIPNGRAEPDFLGWEIKAHGYSRITLMTPEPTGGLYRERGVGAFVAKFGHPTDNDTLYFTGIHRANERNTTTKLSLVLRGFDASRSLIEDVNGAIELVDDDDGCAAAWSFASLMIGWNRKHAQAAYVTYEKRKTIDALEYRYLSPVHLGEGTDFSRYLSAVASRRVIFDPGSKVMNASSARPTVKARSQFRTTTEHLSTLYQKYGPVII